MSSHFTISMFCFVRYDLSHKNVLTHLCRASPDFCRFNIKISYFQILNWNISDSSFELLVYWWDYINIAINPKWSYWIVSKHHRNLFSFNHINKTQEVNHDGSSFWYVLWYYHSRENIRGKANCFWYQDNGAD